MEKNKIGWFSCGVTSAIACHIEKEAELKYISIGSAHPDNIRFINDFEAVTGRKVQIVTGNYKDQFEVIEKTRFINSASGASCTSRLKIHVRSEVKGSHIIGFSLEEKERAKRLRLNYPESDFIFPLINNGLTKRDCLDTLKKLSIKRPLMYELGYKNNNCIGCVKGGRAYWNKIRVDFPDYFNKMAELERSIGYSCIKGIFLDSLPKRPPSLFVDVPQCSAFCQ